MKLLINTDEIEILNVIAHTGTDKHAVTGDDIPVAWLEVDYMYSNKNQQEILQMERMDDGKVVFYEACWQVYDADL